MLTTPSDREIVLTRVFDAKREMVFEAFTNPELLKRWFGPRGCSLAFCDVNLMVGGSFRFRRAGFVFTGPRAGCFCGRSAKWIPPGTRLEFSIHYARASTAGKTDRTSVGLYFAPGQPARVLHRMDLRNFFFLIPAGAPNHEVKRCYTFEKDKLLRRNGQREVLLLVPSYSFNWQLVYRLPDPILIGKGMVLTITAHFDNSANNPANPDPTQVIRWGDKSEEEMLSNYFEFLDPIVL